MTSVVTHSGSAQNLGGGDMSGSIEVFSKLNDYLERRITLWDLESWLVPRLPIYLAIPESAVGQLVGTIELCLAELQVGLRSERSVRALLRGRLPTKTIWAPYTDVQSEDTTSSATSMSTVMRFLEPVPSPFWSSAPEVVNV